MGWYWSRSNAQTERTTLCLKPFMLANTPQFSHAEVKRAAVMGALPYQLSGIKVLLFHPSQGHNIESEVIGGKEPGRR